MMKGIWKRHPATPLYFAPTVSMTITKLTTMEPAVAMPSRNLTMVKMVKFGEKGMPNPKAITAVIAKRNEFLRPNLEKIKGNK